MITRFFEGERGRGGWRNSPVMTGAEKVQGRNEWLGQLRGELCSDEDHHGTHDPARIDPEYERRQVAVRLPQSVGCCHGLVDDGSTNVRCLILRTQASRECVQRLYERPPPRSHRVYRDRGREQCRGGIPTEPTYARRIWATPIMGMGTGQWSGPTVPGPPPVRAR